MPRVGLVEACADPALIPLAPHGAQRELLGLIERHRIVVAACGRRFGKTKAAAAGALHSLLLTPELDGLVSRGEPRYAVSVANSQAQATIFLGLAASLVKSSPALSGELVNETSTQLEFRGGRVLAAFPASARSGRGWAISYLCLDELAHALDVEEGGPKTQERIWASMVPSVAQFGELGRVVVTSTPYGGDDFFATLYAKALNGEIEGAAAFHAPTSANPMIDAAYLAAQEATLGFDDFRREFGAEFVAGGAAFIEPERLQDVVADRQELPREAGRDWSAAIDPSFSRDPTGLAVVGRDRLDRERLVLGYAGRWLPPRPRRRIRRSREEQSAITDEILDGVAGVLRRFGLRQVLSDQHAPGVVTHELAKRGVSVRVAAWTAASRTEALQALRARVYSRRLELYDPLGVPLLAELGRLRTRYRAGSSLVEVPRVGDSHGDVAVALAAAVFAIDRQGVVPSRARFGSGGSYVPRPGRLAGSSGRLRSRAPLSDGEVRELSGRLGLAAPAAPRDGFRGGR